jgi:hydrogenase large subunit
VKKTIVFNPFTRVEGDHQIEVEIANGLVTEARTSGTLYRGFENILRGRAPSDAIVITGRICGSCGGTHAAAASAALADAYGTKPPANGLLARNVILGVETLLSHLSHFYFSFCADFASESEETEAHRRFAPLEGSSYRAAVKARSGLTAILGLLAGKWPNTLAIQPGGTTRPVSRSDLTRALGVLSEFREFVEERMFGDDLEGWLGNRTFSEVERWLGADAHAQSDIGMFLSLAVKQGFEKLGRGPGKFLSSGGWPLPDGKNWLRPGFFDGEVRPCDPDQINEDVRYSWYQSYPGGRRPVEGMSDPAPEKEGAYSWCKAPRYAGDPIEVGPIAPMVIDRDPLIVDAFNRFGSVVLTRMLARLHEITRFVVQIAVWLGEINPEEPFYVKEAPKDTASGCGLVEAPRGMLGHWVQIEKGRIRNYQVVTPTGWNLSPRDERGHPGPLETALVGVPVKDPEHPQTLSHTVRSYDPCLFCTVH